MITTRPEILVIHPLSDQQETKLTGEGLGLMKMSPLVRSMLLLLRLYLIAMTALLAYHMLVQAGVFGHK